MLTRMWMVRDDRDRLTALVRPEDLREGLTDFRRRELRLIVPRHPVVFVMKVLAGLLVIQIVSVAWGLAVHGGVAAPRWTNIVGHFGVASVLFFGIACLHWWRKRRRAVGRCLRWGVCASCGYSLRDAIEQDDGCVVCSECGAAWESSRVGS